jgi:hypothetical protein
MKKLKRILKLAEINYVNARNPHRHIPNRNIIRANTMFMLSILKANIQIRDIFGLHIGRDEWLKSTFDIVKQVSLLSKSKIKKFLGNGAFGAAFELDNGRVLKIGRILDQETSRKSYTGILYGKYDEPEFKDISVKNTLPVFDSGVIKRPSNWINRNLQWSEIPLLKMLDWEQKEAWDELSDLLHFIDDPQEIASVIDIMDTNILDKIGDKESIIKALEATCTLEGDLGDVHADNVGQFIQSGEFVVFDN